MRQMLPEPKLSRVGDGRKQLALVLLTLVALSILPFLTRRSVARLRDDINQRTDPALGQLAVATTEVALEAAARRGYLLTGDEHLAASVTTSRIRRELAVRDLTTYTRALGGHIQDAGTRFVSHLRAVDVQLDSLVAQGALRDRYAATIDRREARFTEALAAADSLRVAIEAAGAERRSRIASVERIEAWLTGALVLLGLAAALAAGRLAAALRAAAASIEASAAEREQLLESERLAREVAETQRRQLERVTESRTRLIRGFTHDVKNPLGAADGHLALIEEGIRGPVAPAQLEGVTRARRSIHVALDLIGQLLDLARAESGPIASRRESVDVAEIARDVVDSFAASAEAKRQEIVLEADAVPPIHSDGGRIRQVVANLVSNAVKYSPDEGRVMVRVFAQEGGDALGGGPWLAVEVADTGSGIAAEHLPLLFNEFTRLDPQAAPGSGIGLAISERLARALGGSIKVESALGEGSTFTLWLPRGGTDRARAS